jgi:hypothetical protein
MRLAILIGLFVALPALAEDPRFGGCPPARDANGRIARSDAVLAEFERAHPRALLPKLLKADGTVEGWYKDHAIPLDCGGRDAVENLQWLPEHAWRDKSKWERKVYGGRSCSPGCP